jgi:hypothetical protein
MKKPEIYQSFERTQPEQTQSVADGSINPKAQESLNKEGKSLNH